MKDTDEFRKRNKEGHKNGRGPEKNLFAVYPVDRSGKCILFSGGVCRPFFYAGNALDRDCGGRVGDVVSVRGVRTCRFTGTGVCGCRDTGGGGFFAWQTAAWGGAMWLLFVMTGYFSAWGKPADWYGGLSFVGAVEAFAGIGQYAGIWPVYSASFPVTGTFDNPAGLAACLAICFPAALYFMASRPVGAKVWGGLSALSMGAAVVLSGSRTGMVAV